MNQKNHRKLARLYLKQGIISLFLLAIAIYMGIMYSLNQTLFPPVIDDISTLSSETYRKESPVVQLQCDNIYYTGYDNHLKDKTTGHYYYTIQNNTCLLILLEPTKNTPEETIRNFQGTFKLVEDNALFHSLTQSLSKDMEWSSRSLQDHTLPIIASQPDYHFLPTIAFLFGLVVCLIIFGYSTISNFYYYFKYF